MKRWIRFVVPTVWGFCLGSAALAQVTNSGFDSPFGPEWTADGQAAIVTGPTGNPYVLLEEPGHGGRSRIYQQISLPPQDPATFLSFRYRPASNRPEEDRIRRLARGPVHAARRGRLPFRGPGHPLAERVALALIPSRIQSGRGRQRRALLRGPGRRDGRVAIAVLGLRVLIRSRL